MAIGRFLALVCSTSQPSGGQNNRLSEFSFADPRSAQKNGRFDILTSKTKNVFEIMVICDWCKPLTGLSDLEISQNQNPDENLRAPFIYMMQCPLAFLDPLDPPSPPPGSLKSFKMASKRHF